VYIYYIICFLLYISYYYQTSLILPDGKQDINAEMLRFVAKKEFTHKAAKPEDRKTGLKTPYPKARATAWSKAWEA